jgi:CrcB protein
MFKTLMFIAIGGAFGATMRFLSQATVYELVGKTFPFGTLFVNVIGSFLMGLLSKWHLAILVGVLGSFTTFSTFSLETLVLLEQGDLFKAMANVLLSVVVCVSAVWAGAYFAKQLV